MELQLIQLYLWVCSVYDKHPMLKYQRLSNNGQPNFTDQELITIYLFGQMQSYFRQTKTHRYISQQFSDWFPNLPAYQTFNYRLNHLVESLQVIVFELCGEFNASADYHFKEDCLIDSMPIMLAVRGRLYEDAWRMRLPLKVIVRARISGITESNCTFWRGNSITSCRSLKYCK